MLESTALRIAIALEKMVVLMEENNEREELAHRNVNERINNVFGESPGKVLRGRFDGKKE